jgi:hypothetical protein
MSTDSEFVWLKGGLAMPPVPFQLVLDLERRGFSMRREGNDLLVVPGRCLTEHDRTQIRQWKTHILALLDYELPPQ